MTDTLLAVCGAFAAFRLTALLTHDYLFAGVRNLLIRAAYRLAYRRRRDEAPKAVYGQVASGSPDFWADHVADDPAPPKLAYVWTCPWCAGLWVSAAVAAGCAALADWSLGEAALAALAFSAVTGCLAGWSLD